MMLEESQTLFVLGCLPGFIISALAVSTILVKSLPKRLKGTLPSVKEFEEEIEYGLKTIESQAGDTKKS